MRILLSGMLAGVPGHGGATWAVLQYLLGLRRLGHDVWFVEPVATIEEPGKAYFRDVVGAFGLGAQAALLDARGQTYGTPSAKLREAARGADLLLNISGLLRDEALLEHVSVRVYLDLDPAFNQLWHEQGVDVGLAGHDRYVTVGRAIGQPGCRIPTCGVDWITTNQPVVLDEWPRASKIEHDAFTTVGNWRAYGSIEHEGVFYGQRVHSLRDLLPLPTLADAAFAPALAIHPAEERDLRALAENGWQLLDPVVVAATPSAYRRFIQGSRAELGVAKAGYVTSRCGWFSDRSVCYLASGRPVLAQDTGFGGFLPLGEGLLSFRGIEEALRGVEEIQSDYSRHARAARALAEEHFDSDSVLARLLAEVTAR